MRALTGMGWCAVLLLAGCASPKIEPPTAAPALTETTRTDEALGAEVRRRLTSAGNDLTGVVIAVSDGVVTLGGSVSNLAAALRAEAAVRGVNGVRAVRNEVLVRGGY